MRIYMLSVIMLLGCSGVQTQTNVASVQVVKHTLVPVLIVGEPVPESVEPIVMGPSPELDKAMNESVNGVSESKCQQGDPMCPDID